jgi:hypothetical protein
MRIDTDILELATAVYEEAVAAVGDGPEAERLAAAALGDLLGRSTLTPAPRTPVRVVHRRRAPRRAALSAAG